MAHLVKRRWTPSFSGGLSRRHRQGGVYHCYVPDHLNATSLRIDADVAADLADAEAALFRLQQAGPGPGAMDGVARFLMRTEAVASSWIEGLSVKARRLATDEACLAMGMEVSNKQTLQILSNVKLMQDAVTMATKEEVFSLNSLLKLHSALLPNLEEAGVLRSKQSWIGGSGVSPLRADFVPPPPERVPELMADLFEYLNNDEHSPLTQAALVHAQLETIHPFADGNGRTGRALIHVVLQRRGITKQFFPPISMALAKDPQAYRYGLQAFHQVGDVEERHSGIMEWLRVFSSATSQICLDSIPLFESLESLQNQWRQATAPTRADSATDALLNALPSLPVFNATTAAARVGRSERRVRAAINQLLEAGVITPRKVGKQRYRVFEVPTILALYDEVEERLR